MVSDINTCSTILKTLSQGRKTNKYVVAGVEWGMQTTDRKSTQILEMIARTSLVILNRGNVSIFRRARYTETIPDITLASEYIVTSEDWKVLEDRK